MDRLTEYVFTACRCKRQGDRLLCQESCPVHSTGVPRTPGERVEIERVTAELGLKLRWWETLPA